MAKISVAIATYNEEDKIENCLKSVNQGVDEIILVDGSSTDQTVQKAKKYKAKIIITDNPENFHLNKQKAIDACSSDWILQLDADEVVTPDLKAEIFNVINNVPKTGNKEKIVGYWIPRKNFFLGKFLKKGGQYPDYTMRLYKKGKGKLPCRSVHEQAEVSGKTGYLINPLLHYPYHNFSDYLTKSFNRYTTHLASEFNIQKININIKTAIHFLLIKPLFWFIWTFIRHKGFLDGFAGFVFSLFSALHYPVAYIKYWENIRNRR